MESHILDGLEALDVGIGIFDEQARLVHCNHSFRELRRYPEALCQPGTTLAAMIRFNAERGDFGPGDPEAQIAERLVEILELGEREVEREMADGQILRIRYRRTPAGGGRVISFQDCTAERRAEAALKASEERYALVSEAAEEAIYEWDIAAGRFYASPRLRAMLGREMGGDGVRGWNWDEIVHPDDLARYRATLERHLAGAEPRWSCEYRLKDAAGAWRWVSDHGTSVRDADGRAVRMVAALRDVTERVERAAALAASEERHALVTRATSDGIYDWNVTEDRLYVSENLIRILDFDLTSRASNAWAERVHRDDYDAYVGAIRAHFRGETEALECEYRVRGAQGGYRWIQDRGIGVRGADGRVVRMVGAVRDISEMKAARAEIGRTEARLASALATISDGLLLVDAENRVQLWNDRYYEIFTEAAGGADLSDVICKDRPFFDMIRDGYDLGMFKPHPDGVEAWVEARTRAWSQPASQWELELANGTWILLNERETPEGGRVSVYTDITELKHREEEIRRQSAILEATLDNMGQGITMVDKDLRTVAFNRKFFELMQFPEDRFGRGFSMEDAFRYNAERGEYGPGDVEQQVRERLALAGRFQPHRFERTRPDGTVLEIVGNPIEGGGLVATYTDITERKRADQALKAALAEFNAVLDTIDYGILFMDADLRARIVNRAFGRLWNIPQDFIDRHPSMRELIEVNRDTGVYDVAPEDWDAWIEDRVEQIKAGRIPPGEFRRADGKVLSYQCVELPDGGRMLTYFDITELKEREAEIITARDAAEATLTDLQKAQARLVQAEKMASLGQLTAGIAHEIKNPLNFVNNFAKLSDELLEELAEILKEPIKALDAETRDDAEDLMATVRENLAKINQHGRRADSIVKNMLLHSREGPSQLQQVRLNAIAEEALNLAYHGARAENPKFNIEMTKALDPEVGEIECYPQDLMRVFLNLITNGMYAANRRAADGAPGYAPEIAVATRCVDGRVEIEVRDNGTGIPAEVRDKIFVPFFTTKPAGEGTGLGLSLSYDIVVKQHGGELTVESEPGVFTAFRVTVPRCPPATGGNHA